MDNAPSDVQLELIDLKADKLLDEQFKTISLLNFYSSLKKEKSPHIGRMLFLFGSTYIYEQTLPVMKLNKSR